MRGRLEKLLGRQQLGRCKTGLGHKRLVRVRPERWRVQGRCKTGPLVHKRLVAGEVRLAGRWLGQRQGRCKTELGHKRLVRVRPGRWQVQGRCKTGLGHKWLVAEEVLLAGRWLGQRQLGRCKTGQLERTTVWQVRLERWLVRRPDSCCTIGSWERLEKVQSIESVLEHRMSEVPVVAENRPGCCCCRSWSVLRQQGHLQIRKLLKKNRK